jgi:ABC-2 type transport system permease protein
MRPVLVGLWAEGLKIIKSKVFWFSILFFLFVTLMMGLIMFVQIHPEIAKKLGMIGTKATLLRFGAPTWSTYFTLLEQAVAAIGLVGFGFVTSWIFGREYSDKTAKDILALPISRSYIVLSKFIVSVIWCIILATIFFSFALLLGKIVGISGWSGRILSEFFRTYIIVSSLTILLCTPVAFFASFGRGYLLPFAFIILTLILANFIGFVGLGAYFPWAIPGILCTPSIAGVNLNIASYIILFMTSGLGYIGTLVWWIFADHK